MAGGMLSEGPLALAIKTDYEHSDNVSLQIFVRNRLSPALH